MKTNKELHKMHKSIKAVTYECLACHHGEVPVQIFSVRRRKLLGGWAEPTFLVTVGGIMQQCETPTINEALGLLRKCLNRCHIGPGEAQGAFRIDVNNIETNNIETLELLKRLEEIWE